MTEAEIKELFEIATTRLGWYRGSSIKCSTANNYKQLHFKGTLPIEKYLFVLWELGKINVTKR
ncbi:MAG: hypothetical protein FWD66_06405 [Paludibacter sp.]|nr:hypothetical protein [Paludibacter sp.]